MGESNWTGAQLRRKEENPRSESVVLHPPFGVHCGDIKGHSLEPKDHEESLGEGAVPNFGSITASLGKRNTRSY